MCHSIYKRSLSVAQTHGRLGCDRYSVGQLFCANACYQSRFGRFGRDLWSARFDLGAGGGWRDVLAPLSERLAGPFSLVVGAVGVSAGLLLVGVAAGPISFMLALGLASAGSGIIDVSSSARIAGIEARNQRPLMNLNHAFYSFCYAGAPFLTGAARVAGWSTIKVFLVLMVAILLLCFVMYGPDTHIDEDEDDVAVNGKLPTALIWITGLIVLMAFLTESSTEGWSALHIERSLGGGGGVGEGALGPAVLGLTMGFGRLSGHAVSKYVPDLILMATACMLSAIGIALAAVATTIQMAYVGFALGGLGISVVGTTGTCNVGALRAQITADSGDQPCLGPWVVRVLYGTSFYGVRVRRVGVGDVVFHDRRTFGFGGRYSDPNAGKKPAKINQKLTSLTPGDFADAHPPPSSDRIA
jgi:MFS family permease